MLNKPLISVVMSTLNPNEYELKRAVQSIIDQSYDAWELLLYDDGSKSDDSEKIKALADSDTRISYIPGKNTSGLAAGLNICLNHARGKHIARMDDDDISLPERFKCQVQFLEEHPEYHWVGTLADLFDENGIWGRADRPSAPTKEDFLHSSPFIHPSVMFRREVLMAVGGYQVSRETSRCEDYELFMRLYSQGYQGYNIQKPLLLYQESGQLLKRSWRYSYYEMLVRWRGFRKLKILTFRTFPRVFKPLAVRLAAMMPRVAQRVRTNRSKGDHIAGRKSDRKE